MCAVAFYMMENYPLDVGPEFMAGVIQVVHIQNYMKIKPK